MSHLLGLVLAVVGTVFLLMPAIEQDDRSKLVSFAIYGGTLVLMYAASTAYHSTRGRLKRVFRRLDHHSIYLLIAGTYTPFALVGLGDGRGRALLALIWALALFGMIQEAWLGQRTRVGSLVVYLSMGWLGLAAAIPLVETLSLGGFGWLLTGGLLYTAGVYFYCRDDRVRHAHGIWHLFVLGGSSVHYFVVFAYLALPAARWPGAT